MYIEFFPREVKLHNLRNSHTKWSLKVFAASKVETIQKCTSTGGWKNNFFVALYTILLYNRKE